MIKQFLVFYFLKMFPLSSNLEVIMNSQDVEFHFLFFNLVLNVLRTCVCKTLDMKLALSLFIFRCKEI